MGKEWDYPTLLVICKSISNYLLAHYDLVILALSC